MNAIRQLTHTRLLAVYSITALLLIGCSEHLPPSSFAEEEPPAPRVFTRVSLTFSMPVEMETYTSTWEAKTFPGIYLEGDYEYRSRKDTVNYTFTIVDSSAYSSGDTVRFRYAPSNPSIYREYFTVLDTDHFYIDSLALIKKDHYYIPVNSGGINGETTERLDLHMQRIPCAFVGDTLVATVVGQEVGNTLQSLTYFYYLLERHLPHPHYINRTERYIEKILPANARSSVSIRMW